MADRLRLPPRKAHTSPAAHRAPTAEAPPLARRRHCLRTRLDRETTRPMVWLALVFLAVMAVALPHGLMNLPEETSAELAGRPSSSEAAAVEPGSAAAVPQPSPRSIQRVQRATIVNNLAVGLLVLLAIPFWLEALLRLLYIERGGGDCRVPRPSRGRAVYILCCALVPPLRTGLHPATMRGFTWLPMFGWRRITGRLARGVQRAFGVPMLCIGLLILPVLVGEIVLGRQAHEYTGVALGLDVATRLIWFAFALEFTVMTAVTARKLEYALRHWVDLVIILLPFVAFLRSLQVLRAGQVLKAQQISQFARTYRLRGVFVKLLQAVLMLRVLEGLSERAAERRVTGLREQIHRRHAEIDELDAELRQVRAELARRKRQRREARRARRLKRDPADGLAPLQATSAPAPASQAPPASVTS